MSVDLVPVNGKRIKAYRKYKNWSQNELARRANVSRSYLAEIEQGVKSPRFLYAQAIADALDVSVDDLRRSANLSRTAGSTPRNRETVPS